MAVSKEAMHYLMQPGLARALGYTEADLVKLREWADAVADAERDSERLDWLEQHMTMYDVLGKGQVWEVVLPQVTEQPEFRELLDAAMKHETP
jgi:hypothetical protein